jgi:hypothetical protein
MFNIEKLTHKSIEPSSRENLEWVLPSHAHGFANVGRLRPMYPCSPDKPISFRFGELNYIER